MLSFSRKSCNLFLWFTFGVNYLSSFFFSCFFLQIKDISLTPYAQLHHNPDYLHALQEEPDSSDDEAHMPAFVDIPEIPDVAPQMPMFC